MNTREDFLKENPHLKEFMPWLDLLRTESPRGSVLISAGFLEQQLKDILEAFFAKNVGAEALFEGGSAPLGSFSARTAACYALSLISEAEHNDLVLIRKIRNDFAHRVHTSFKTPSVRDRCKLLKFKAHDYTHPKRGEVIMTAESQFGTAAAGLVLNLVNRPYYVSQQRRSFKAYPY